jgi:hypothetical protein
MMHSKGFKLETENESHLLIDVFNSMEENFIAEYRNSTIDEKRALLKAIINYPYDND